MAEVEILYSPAVYDNMILRVTQSKKYTWDERTTLQKMLLCMKEDGRYLEFVEVYKPDYFNFEIENFDEMKAHLINEVYLELIEQMLEKYKDYEEVSYRHHLRNWFRGMTFNTELLVYLDKRFKEQGTKIHYD